MGPPLQQVLRIEIAASTIWRTIGAILLTVVLLRAGSAARGLLSRVALAFFFSLALDPAVRWLHHRYRWRRGAAVAVIYLAGVTAMMSVPPEWWWSRRCSGGLRRAPLRSTAGAREHRRHARLQ